MPVFNKLIYNGTEYTLWWGGNIGEPLNLTVSSSWTDAIITWEDNEIWTIPPTTFQKSELVRKIGSAPTSPSDWTLVVTETVKDTYKVSGYVDSWLTDWTTYYYRVFSYSDLWWISYCDAVSVTISNAWQPWANTLCYYNINDGDTNSTIYDLSWNSVDQTRWGTPTYTTDWTYGRIAVFDGNSYTTANSIVDFGLSSTWILLFNPTAVSDDRAIVTEWAGSGRPIGIVMRRDGNNYTGMFAWQGVNWENSAVQTSWITPTANQWIMIAVTRASDWTAKIYINWVLNNTAATTESPNYSSWANLQIGRWRSGDPHYPQMQFKLFIWEDRTWTDQEIADIAAEYGF